MATSGGIVSIIFEADTSKIEKAFSDIEKKASKIDIKALNAETRNLNAQTAKLAAQTAKIEAAYKKAHPEIDKSRVSIERLAEKNKVLLEQEKTKQTQIKANAEESIRLAELQTAKEMQQQKRLSADWVRSVKNKFNLEREYRKDELNELKRKYAYETEQSKLAVQQEKERERALKYEQQTRLALDKAKQAQEAKTTKQLEQQEKAEAKRAERLEKERDQQITRFAHQLFTIRTSVQLLREGFEGISQSINNILSFTGRWVNATLKLINPVGVITNSFLKSSGIFAKIKQFFSPSSLIEFGKSAITAASDLTEVQNIVETAFPNMTGQMNEWAENSIDMMGLSQKSAKQYAATLGLMAQSAGIAEKASYKLGTGLTTVTADLASIYNIKAEDVYEKIRSGVIGGRTAAIAQLGINMNQANLQAYMASKGMAEKYSTLDNATKTAIRYNYVLEQTKKIQGDFLKTQGTWANQTRILNESITQLKSSIGTFLVSVLTPLLQKLNQLIKLLIVGVDKLRDILNILGIQIQTAASQSSSGISNLTDELYENAEAAEAANSAAAKLTDGPFSEMHKLSGDDGEGNKLGNIFGGADGLINLEEPYKLKTLNTVEEYLNRLKSKLDLGELKIAGTKVLEEIVHWCKAIKQAWKDAWNDDNKGIKLLQSIVDMATEILNLIGDISAAFRNQWESGWGKTIFDHALDVVTHINQTVEKIVKKFRDFWNAGSGRYGTMLTEQGDINSHKLSIKELVEGKRRTSTIETPDAFKIHKNMANSQEMLASQTEFRELTWGEYIAQQFYKVQTAALEAADAVLTFVNNITENLNFEKLGEHFRTLTEDMQRAFKTITDWLSNEDNAEKVAKIIENVTDGLVKFVDKVLKFIADNPQILDKLADILLKLSEHTEQILSAKAAWDLFGPAVGGGLKFIGAAWGIGKFAKITTDVGKATEALKGLDTATKTATTTVGTTTGATLGQTIIKGLKGFGLSAGVTAIFTQEIQRIKMQKAGDWIFKNMPKMSDYVKKEDFAKDMQKVYDEASKKYGEAAEHYFSVIGDKNAMIDEYWRIHSEQWVKENRPNPDDFINSEEYYAALDEYYQKMSEYDIENKEFVDKRKSYSKEWTDYEELCNKQAVDSIEATWVTLQKSMNTIIGDISDNWTRRWQGIMDTITKAQTTISNAINKLKELIGLQQKAESKSKFNGSSGVAFLKTTQIGNYAKVRFNANGGAYKPNDPQLRVIGDSSQHEYDLTESHLDDIANRMTGAVINGFMRVSSMNTGSKGNVQPIINIQMGDEQFKDFIVRVIEENGYRFS